MVDMALLKVKAQATPRPASPSPKDTARQKSTKPSIMLTQTYSQVSWKAMTQQISSARLASMPSGSRVRERNPNDLCWVVAASFGGPEFLSGVPLVFLWSLDFFLGG